MPPFKFRNKVASDTLWTSRSFDLWTDLMWIVTILIIIVLLPVSLTDLISAATELIPYNSWDSSYVLISGVSLKFLNMQSRSAEYVCYILDFFFTWAFVSQDYEEDEEDDDDDEDDTGMGDEGEDSNEGTGSADGNDGYEADDAEVTG